MGRGKRSGGMRTFIMIWAGQCVSLVGTGLTSFSLGIWVYQRTGSVTKFALISLFSTLPVLLLMPLIGALADRWDRRLTMIMSDTVAALCTLGLAALVSAGRLDVWEIYVVLGVVSLCSAFRWPAYTASTTLLVAKRDLGRVSGLAQMGPAAAQILAPALAGVLLVTVGIGRVLLIDFSTYLVALTMLLIVRVPRPEATDEGKAGKGTLLGESSYGWRYLAARPGLLGLLVFFAVANFLVGMSNVLATPLILSFASPAVLGTVLSIGGAGMLFGTVLMVAWGGPKRRVNGVLGFLALIGLCIVLAGLRPSAPLVGAACFLFFMSLPITNGSSQAIWQTKVAPDVQGRVFAMRAMIGGSCLPLAYFVAGPLADRVFEPLLAPGGPLADSVGRVLGTGKGRGIGLLFVLIGLLTVLGTAIGYRYPRLRLVEDELPDFVPDEAQAAADERGRDELPPLPTPFPTTELQSEADVG
ncbi:MAG TPA: MFS transporter [Pyrinomonadaceae bacterium]